MRSWRAGRPGQLSSLLVLATALGAAGSVRAQMGLETSPGGVPQREVVEQGVGWLSQGHYVGPPPSNAFPLPAVGRSVRNESDLPASDRPWSFDTYNGKHSLLAVRALECPGGRGNFDHGLSPLEKYDNLVAQAKAGRGSSPEDLLKAMPGAARWEADPRNEHNQAAISCRDPGSGRTSPGRLPVLVQDYLGGDEAVKVLPRGDAGGSAFEVQYQDQGHSASVSTTRLTTELTRTESHARPGRLPTDEDQMVVDRTYPIEVYWYPSGVTPPPGMPQEEARRYRRNLFVRFPSRAISEALRARGEPPPEGSGWLHRRWDQRAFTAGVSWSGHCAGFAAASVLFKEPPARKVVALPGRFQPFRLKAARAAEACFENLVYEPAGAPTDRLVFENWDLKGLAIVLGGSVEVGFRTSAREETDLDAPAMEKIEYPRGAAGRRVFDREPEGSEAWDDITPEWLMTLLWDYLRPVQQGGRGHPVVIDRHPCHPVWNSPAYGYHVTYTRVGQNLLRGTAQIHYAGYGATLCQGVRAQPTRGTQEMQYPRDGVAPYSDDDPDPAVRGQDLVFELELGTNGAVSRGRWTSRTIRCPVRAGGGTKDVPIHPDFLWVPMRLLPPERASTGRMNRNPVVEERWLFSDYAVLAEEDPATGRRTPYLRPWVRR